MKITKNHIILIIKLLVISAAFALIIEKSDTAKILSYIKKVDPLAIISAYLFLLLAQIISSYRTKFYFSSSGLELNSRFSIGLYFTGMLYNNILPGGIGGDAYKIYLIGKLANFSKITAFRLIISDRASGLFILLMLAFWFARFANIPYITTYSDLLIGICALITIPCYFISIKLLLKESPVTALKASIYSLFVQLCGVAIVISVMAGLGVDLSGPMPPNYILLFLTASVLSVLPISIGGVGIRELTFLYGASWLAIDAELGITIGIIFFVISLICSLNGLFFWHRLERMYKEK